MRLNQPMWSDAILVFISLSATCNTNMVTDAQMVHLPQLYLGLQLHYDKRYRNYNSSLQTEVSAQFCLSVYTYN